MRIVAIILLCLMSFEASAQFFYTRTAPETKYLIDDVRAQQETAYNIDLNSSDQSFSLAAWIDVSEYLCDDFAFGTDQIKVILVKYNNRYKVRLNLKDSLVVEGSTFEQFGNSDLLTASRINSHIVVTYDGSGSISIYVNGSKIGNDGVTNLGNPLLSEAPLIIGSAACDLKLYNLSSYSFELTQSQVNTLFRSVDAKIGTPSVYITGSEKYKQSGFFDNVFQKWKIPNDGRVLSIPVWGDGTNNNQDYRSPLGGGVFYSPFMMYNSDQSKTYIGTTSRGGPGFGRGYYIANYDHTNNNFSITDHINPSEPLIHDYHHTSRVFLGKDSSLIHISEKDHNGDVYVHKKNNYEGVFMKVDSIESGQIAYAQPFYLGANLFLIGRSAFYRDYIYKSTDDGDSWGAANEVVRVNTNDRAYFTTQTYNDSILYYGVINRNLSGAGVGTGEYDQIFLLRSLDGENFCNTDLSRCENITSGYWDINELKAHAAIDSTTDSSSSTTYQHSLIDTAGRFHTLRVNNQLSLLIHSMYDDGWTHDTIESPRESSFPLMVYKGGDSFDLWGIKADGDTEKVVRKTTSDNFQSFGTEQTIFVNNYSDEGRMLLNVTQNQGYNIPVILAATLNVDSDKQQSALWIYQYNPWNQL